MDAKPVDGAFLEGQCTSSSCEPQSHHLFLSLLTMGCAGTVSGVACVYPEPFVAVYRAFKEGDQERAMASQAIGVKLATVLKGGSNIAYYKAALRRRGIDAGHMRKPQLDLTGEERSQVAKALEAVEREFPGEWNR